MSEIVANTNTLIDMVPATFRFKKDKMGNKRPAVELKIPVPSVEGIVEILRAGGKELDLLQDVLFSTVKGVAGEFVSNDEKISQETLPVAQLFWSVIANMPKAERATISTEQWESFGADYLSVMPSVTGKTPDQVGLALQLFLKKLASVKTNKPVLKVLQTQLGLYMETSNAEQFSDVLELLNRRLDAYLSAEEPVILAENL